MARQVPLLIEVSSRRPKQFR